MAFPAGLCAVCLIEPIHTMQSDMCAFYFGIHDRGGRGWLSDVLESMARGLAGDGKTTSSSRMLSHMCMAHASINLPQHGMKGNGCGEALLDSQRLRAGLKVAAERCQPP